ncbi:MAG: hypothetical protein J7496_06625 [Novosphingobium sp.]|nr:hypothetical protein [Novosphingobium sp.]MBO9602165.1 hypothetical protein [Novosphingobium sp.]
MAVVLALACPAGAETPRGDPAAAPALQPGFRAPRTPWGDPDLRGTWPLQAIWDAGIPLQREDGTGPGGWLTDAEYAQRLADAEKSDAEFSVELGGGGTNGLADWLRHSALGRRSALLVDPPDGRLPPLTPGAEALYAKGRSTWQTGGATDWIDDLDPFERCITRGFPAVMLPQPYNNGIRLFQAPGYVVLQLETFGSRVIPLGDTPRWPEPVRAWHGDSRGHWEGDTLVIETTNIVDGDSVTRDLAHRAAGPFPGRDHATLPVGPAARTVERLTMTGPDTIDYRVTYSDPATFTAPWTVALEWTRDESYAIYEYACHEGNTAREAITAARAGRKAKR